MIEYKKNILKSLRDTCHEDFQNGVAIDFLMKKYSEAIEAEILKLWHTMIKDNTPLSLMAAGSLSEKTLQPYSDLDLLILYETHLSPSLQNTLEHFIRELWDMGFELGQHIASLNQMIENAKTDPIHMTNFSGARFLSGNKALFEKFQEQLSPKHLWDSRSFFLAKTEEQNKRYHKYDDTSHNLEPDLKNGPGGLRDLQSILWIGKRQYDIKEFSDLIHLDFLSEQEYEILENARLFLYKISYALHFISGKKESRLLFEYQKKISMEFAYQDSPKRKAIEHFMLDYFRTVQNCRRINEILLQLYREKILFSQNEKIIPFSSNYLIVNQTLKIQDPELLKKEPYRILEIFLILAKHPEIENFHSETIRLIYQSRNLIDETFRKDIQNKKLFIELFKEPNRIAEIFQLMNRYHILEKMILPFKDIIGHMQYDLYHIYTVDRHILFLIRNLERFTKLEFRSEFPLCAEITVNINQFEILVIAGIFHDIAKGRGGAHEKLGMEEALLFCQEYEIEKNDADLIVWLVENHLLMSRTAQKQDIYDPEIISLFAQKVKTKRYLDHLYLLTVSDICATNPALWNNWRDTLLRDLYHSTKNLLNENNKIQDLDKMMTEKKNRVLEFFNDIEKEKIERLWSDFKSSYFLREKTKMLVLQTKAILKENPIHQPLVQIFQLDNEGGTALFLYLPNKKSFFSKTTTIIANTHLSIAEANITLTKKNFILATFIILDEQGKTIKNTERLQYLQEALKHFLSSGIKKPRLSQKRITRSLKYFDIPTEISFEQDTKDQRTLLSIVTLDKPGLLAKLARVFSQLSLQLLNAKIATLGERVEDVFALVDQEGKPLLNPVFLEEIKKRCIKLLS